MPLRDALIDAFSRDDAVAAAGGAGIAPRPLVQLFLDWPELPLYANRIERDGSLLPIRVDVVIFATARDFSGPFYVIAKGEHADCPLLPNDPPQRIAECHRRIWLPTTRERYRACRFA